MLTATPFVVIAGIAVWKQARSPRCVPRAATLEAASALSLREFVDALAVGFERQGYEVRRLAKSAADLELSKVGRKSLVGCRRWKAASTRVEPLRDLHAAGEAERGGRVRLRGAGRDHRQRAAVRDRKAHPAAAGRGARNDARRPRGRGQAQGLNRRRAFSRAESDPCCARATREGLQRRVERARHRGIALAAEDRSRSHGRTGTCCRRRRRRESRTRGKAPA